MINRRWLPIQVNYPDAKSLIDINKVREIVQKGDELYVFYDGVEKKTVVGFDSREDAEKEFMKFFDVINQRERAEKQVLGSIL